MIKLLFVIFLFSFSFTNISAKEKFTEKCDGFCEGKKLKIEVAGYPQPSYRIIDGKRKKAPKWMIARVARMENSFCMPFDSYVSRSIPKNFKKKETEKNMEDFRNGKDIFDAVYSINSCRPCPSGMKAPKRDKTGYCPIAMINLRVMYSTAWEKGYEDPKLLDISQIGLGRDESSDRLTNLSNALSKTVLEYLNFPISLKKDIQIVRYKDKASGNLYYFYNEVTYKTAAKNQVLKETQMEYLDDQILTEFLDLYIDKIQQTYSTVFDKQHEDFKNISKLYELIPSDNEIKLFENSLKKVATYHFQNRD